ncbi:MAG: TraB/GumN family protein [Flavobacterium sp.]|nr:TraB/GumN family protein [Flavobacterium sp.]
MLLLLCSIGNAQKLENSLLWKITGNGLKKPSYVLGTMHLICDPTLSPKTLRALDKTSQLYLEIDLTNESSILNASEDFYMEENQTIKGLLTEEEYLKLDEFLKKYMSVSLELLNNVKPINISYLLYPFFLECDAESIESQLVKITKEQNELTFGLESNEAHNAVIDNYSNREQLLELLELTKKDDTTLKNEAKQMAKIYLAEDIEQMYANSNEENAQFNEVILNDRNKKWIPVMEKAMKEKPTFFGVGAAHLAGEEGVIKLLRKQGYKVEPVK